MKHMKAIVLYLLLTCLAVVAYAQPYPGGISADLEAWYDASALSLSNNDPVASWTDMSGNGYNSTQANAANRPIFVENVINGQPVVRFDGSDDYLQTVLASAIPQPITVFIVLKLPSNNATIQNVFDGLGTNRLQFNKQAGNDTFRAFAGTIDDLPVLVMQAILPQLPWCLMVLILKPGLMAYRLTLAMPEQTHWARSTLVPAMIT